MFSQTKLTSVIVSTQTKEAQDKVDGGIDTRIRELVANLKTKTTSLDDQTIREATSELRRLSKDMENAISIAGCGGISPLVDLLECPDIITQENAVTSLLNLSISNNNKINIVKAESFQPLVHVLQTGTPEARENAAATLYNLCFSKENKIRIGSCGAVGPLVELLRCGTHQGKKDAATALFCLSTCAENRLTIVRSGAVKHLIDLMNPATGMVDRAVVVLANLASNYEGRKAIAEAGGISLLVEAIELGSPREKENAAAALVHFCSESNRYCRKVLEEGAVPSLVILSNSGTSRAKEKVRYSTIHFTLLPYYQF